MTGFGRAWSAGGRRKKLRLQRQTSEEPGKVKTNHPNGDTKSTSRVTDHISAHVEVRRTRDSSDSVVDVLTDTHLSTGPCTTDHHRDPLLVLSPQIYPCRNAAGTSHV